MPAHVYAHAFAMLLTLGCATNPPGAETLLRAYGQEPFWNLELNSEHMVLGRLGVDEPLRVPLPDPQLDPRTGDTVYQHADGTFVISALIREERCQDTMSGEWYPLRVIVRLSGVELRGCGHYSDRRTSSGS